MPSKSVTNIKSELQKDDFNIWKSLLFFLRDHKFINLHQLKKIYLLSTQIADSRRKRESLKCHLYVNSHFLNRTPIMPIPKMIEILRFTKISHKLYEEEKKILALILFLLSFSKTQVSFSTLFLFVVSSLQIYIVYSHIIY